MREISTKSKCVKTVFLKNAYHTRWHVNVRVFIYPIYRFCNLRTYLRTHIVKTSKQRRFGIFREKTR